MSALADLAFDCPVCRGPVIAELAHAGAHSQCPHCYEEITIPSGKPVNKDKFIEPPGLRRILQEVRDREWEILRRKLRASKTRVNEVETELSRMQEALASQAPAPAPAAIDSGEVEALRKQIAELNEKISHANQAFTAGRKQHEVALDRLRHDLETSREEAQAFRKKSEEAARALGAVNSELEKHRTESSKGADAWEELKAELERAKGALAEAQSKLAAAQAELEAEKAKVFLMEAASGAAKDEPADAPAAPQEAAAEGTERIAQLETKVAELQKSNDALRSARDRLHVELEEIKKKIAASEDEDIEIETALSELESDLKEVVQTLSKRRVAAR